MCRAIDLLPKVSSKCVSSNRNSSSSPPLFTLTNVSVNNCVFKINLWNNYRTVQGWDEVDWSNNVLSKFIFFFWMPFFRKALFLYILSNKTSFKKKVILKDNRTKNNLYIWTKIFFRLTFFQKSFFFQKLKKKIKTKLN